MDSNPIIDEELLGVFLYTEFQHNLEKARDIAAEGPPSEEKPFDHHYKARAVLESLLKSLKSQLHLPPELSLQQGFNFIEVSLSEDEPKLDLPEWAEALPPSGRLALGILMAWIGQNHSDSQQYPEALSYLGRSLELLNSLENETKFQHFNIIQKVYNQLGIVYCNKQTPEKGLAYFKKAELVYNLAKDSGLQNVTPKFKTFLKGGSGDPEEPKDFAFYIDGGVRGPELERQFTMSAFFLTQAYTHTHQKQKAITYCALTMKRQLESGDFELKQWSHNAMQLSDYFLDKQHFAQAEYCLFAGLTLLPGGGTGEQGEESKEALNVTTTSIGTGRIGFPEEMDKLLADFNMQLGRYYLARLQFIVEHFNKNIESEDPELAAKMNQQFILFELGLKWPNVFTTLDKPNAETFFKLANTRFKRSLKFYKLDGFVTEHVELTRHTSQLYEELSGLQDKIERAYAMQERRLAMLEPIASVLNKKVYENFYILLTNDIADITCSLFELQMNALEKKAKVKPKQKQQVNSLGEKSIAASQEIIEIYWEIMKREGEEKGITAELKKEYAQSLINLHFKAARICTKLLALEPKWHPIEVQKRGLKHYEEIVGFVEGFQNEDKRLLSKSIWEQYQQCKEMVELLPIKLLKIQHALNNA